ncbi:DUF695 domain-containing protein [Paenibacillus hodogayensis]|uniref:DUF695 domain-containing protein n=1 Tax=Paenibacillus hodogayensis TaxID=279208 RepID=A0ABV5W5A7_9BACL
MAKQWDYFNRTTDQKEQMSVLVDAAHAGYAPLPGFTRLLSIVINLYAIATDKKERDSAQAKLGILERRLEHMLAEHTQAIYIGRINTETRLEFYYYAKPGGAPHKKLAERVMALYPNYRWLAAERDDGDWSFYDYLRPNEVEKLYAKNNILLRSLSEKGDRLGIPRHVYHWLRFSTGEELAKAEAGVKRLGYGIVSAGMDADKPSYPHSLIVSKTHPIAIHAMNDSVGELYGLANECGGLYEGWGTDIRRKLWRRIVTSVGGKRIAVAGLAALAVLIAVSLLAFVYA